MIALNILLDCQCLTSQYLNWNFSVKQPHGLTVFEVNNKEFKREPEQQVHYHQWMVLQDWWMKPRQHLPAWRHKRIQMKNMINVDYRESIHSSFSFFSYLHTANGNEPEVNWATTANYSNSPNRQTDSNKPEGIYTANTRRKTSQPNC